MHMVEIFDKVVVKTSWYKIMLIKIVGIFYTPIIW